jgi:hypothetical protein
MSGAIYLGVAECAKEAALVKSPRASGSGRQNSTGNTAVDTRPGVGSSGGDGVGGGHESVGRWLG